MSNTAHFALRRFLALNPSAKGVSAKSRGGFTLVEVNLSIAVLAILSVGILSVFTNFFVILTRDNLTADMTAASQSLLRTMVEELRYGAGVRNTNSISDANQPSGWNTSNTSFVIIIAVPAVNSSDDYIINPGTGTAYLNELVYYKSGSTLYKRTLANSSATGNTLKTSCPEAIATPSCPADRKLVDTLSTIQFTLYDQDNATTTDPLEARSVKIDLTLSKETFGQPLTVDNSIRITLRNLF